MNPHLITIKLYLPKDTRERTKLQHIKDKYGSFTQTNKEGISKDLFNFIYFHKYNFLLIKVS